MISRFRTLLAFLVVVSPGFSQAQTTGNAQIQYLSEQLFMGSEVTVAGETLASSQIIPEFYSRREFTPAWTDHNQVEEFIRLVARAGEEGLDPADYLHSEISGLFAELRQNPDDAITQGQLDVLLTESFSRYGNHLVYGKVDPAALDENWNWTQGIGGQDPVTLVQQAIDSPSIARYFDDFLERPPIYLRMREILAEYRGLVDAGGWPTIGEGPTLRPGMQDDRIPVIRTRLAITGDLPASEANQSRSYDPGLEAGLKAFQDRHNLDADGIVGARTLAAMNVSVESRIDQIRVNLERMRWVVRDLDDDFVVTNIAAFQTHLVRDSEVVWSTRSQVGRDYRQTPIFRDRIKYLQFNPTWTAPPGILTNDILPAVRNDIGYLAGREIDLIDNDGNIVDPTTVDWSRYVGGRQPPFRFVQRPGPANAMGRVKFMFPNPHFVFLHDTPSRSLFDRTDRSFSSGCIRLENPIELAELLLSGSEKWDPESIQALLDAKKPQNVFLEEPLTVMLLYGTVAAIDMELVRFYNDVYQRDARVLESLNSPFVFRRPTEQ